jgi:hypothetical protein
VPVAHAYAALQTSTFPHPRKSARSSHAASWHNVLLAALAMQSAWDPEVRTTARSAAMAECRLLLRECGLTPMARRSLQIEIARAEDATERREAKKSRVPVVDPRVGIHAV